MKGKNYKIKNGVLTFFDNVIKINPRQFVDRQDITCIVLPKNVYAISSYAFKNCKNLKKIEGATGLAYIEGEAFYGCENLEEFPDNLNLKKIGSSAFENCQKLKNMRLYSEEELELGIRSFANCTNLEWTIINGERITVQKEAFENCTSLKKVAFYGKCDRVGARAFASCQNLREVINSNSVYEYEKECFASCQNLKSIKLSRHSVMGIDVFQNSPNTTLKTFYGEELFADEIHFVWIMDKNQVFVTPREIFTVDETGKRIFELNEFNVLNFDQMMSELQTKNNKDYILSAMILSYYLPLVVDIDRGERYPLYAKITESYLQNKSVYWSKGLLKNFNKKTGDKIDNKSLGKYIALSYILGSFSDDAKTQIKSDDFLMHLKQEELESLMEINFNFTNKKGEFIAFRKPLASFIINEFSNIKKYEKTDFSGLLERIINNWDDVVKKHNENNDKNLELNAKRALEYLSTCKFNNIKIEDFDFAKIITPHIKSQNTYDNALNHYKNAVEQNIHNIYQDINLQREGKVEIVPLTNKTEKSEYSFEWLDKLKPQNLVLGAFVDCCARLEDFGEGLAYGGMVKDNSQNLLLYKKNKLVGKALININREKGYGVFNTVEIALNKIVEADKIKIYEQFINGIQAFVDMYNQNHNVKITEINCGGSANDLRTVLKDKHKITDKFLLQQDDYSVLNNWKDNAFHGNADILQYEIMERGKIIAGEQTVDEDELADYLA